MMSPSENRRSNRPYETTPTMPPTATAVVSRPNPTAPMPSRSVAYRTSTDQAAPNVTLNVKIVRASVRIGGCAEQPADPFAHLGPQARTARGPRSSCW